MTRALRILQLTAIGDAMGAGYEYAPQEVAEQFKIEDGYKPHPLYPNEIQPGQWTDDTMLSYAMARCIVHNFRDVQHCIIPYRLAESMIDVHRDHPTKGYSKGMLAALDGAKTAQQLKSRFDKAGRSESNGSAMRSACCGVLSNPSPTVRSCASLTHMGFGIEGADVVASVANYFIFGNHAKKDLNRHIEQTHGSLWTTRMRERVTKGNGPLTFLTVCAALTAIRESDFLSEVLTKSIRVGGDVDTVAAISMGLASTCKEIVDDLPKWVYDGIRPVAGLTFETLADYDAKLSYLAEQVQ